MKPLVELIGISKTYGATVALAGVSLSLRAGEIHALLGENGAGKSTLVKVISGNVQSDAGAIAVDGKIVRFANPREAQDCGVAVVHQELSVIENLTAAQNICLAALPIRNDWIGRVLEIVDRDKCRKIAGDALRQMNHDLPLDVPVRTLRQAERQIIEIARALATRSRALLLDEPTSSLPPSDRKTLYDLMRRIADQGMAVAIITHSLEEALEISDRVTVLRDGANVWSGRAADTDVKELIEHMTGQAGGDIFPQRRSEIEGKTLLRVSDASISPVVQSVSFDVLRGEIVGLVGLVGSGGTEILNTLFGRNAFDGGDIRFADAPMKLRSPRDAVARGIAYIPGDRQQEALFPPLDVAQNIVIARQFHPNSTGGLISCGLLRRKETLRLAARLKEAFSIKAPGLHASIGALSGGNQQKAILARWLATEPLLLLADEPTRGVSVGSKMEIYRMLRERRDAGMSILIASSDYDELIGLCDRVYILAKGRICGEYSAKDLSSPQLLKIVLDQNAGKSGNVGKSRDPIQFGTQAQTGIQTEHER